MPDEIEEETWHKAMYRAARILLRDMEENGWETRINGLAQRLMDEGDSHHVQDA